MAAGTYTDPKTARTTVAQWCDAWLAGVRPAHVAQIGSASADLVLGASPWALERSIRAARGKVDGLPPGFRYHDLRHYFASQLIASGADVKTVQARLRHASAKTTLDTYGHLWPDRDESTRAAVEAVFVARNPADSVRTDQGAR